MPYRLHQQGVIDEIEEPLDVEIKHPVVLPATHARHGHCLMCRLARPLAVRVGMEARFQWWLKTLFDHHLSHQVRDRRYPQRSHTATCLRNLHTSNRWRLITSRGQLIPEFIKVVSQPPIELLDRLPIDSSAPVGLDLLVDLPHFTLENIKRFGMPRQILPLPVVCLVLPGNVAHSVRPRYRAFLPTTDDSPLCRAVLRLLQGLPA